MKAAALPESLQQMIRTLRVSNSKPMHAQGINRKFLRCVADALELAGNRPEAGSLASGTKAEEAVRRWAVFCDTCGKQWSVPSSHSGKDRCNTCRDTKGAP